MTTLEIASLAFPSWSSLTPQQKRDAVELTRYRLDNPDLSVECHHRNYVAILAARGKQQGELTEEEMAADVDVVAKIVELKEKWDGR